MRDDTPLDATAARWRELLLEVSRPCLGWPILLSGGVDSGTLLAAQLALDARPVCYAFRLASYTSTDFRVAQKMTADHGLTLVDVVLDDSLPALERDVLEVMTLLDTSRKAAIQCAQPIMHLCRQLRGNDGSQAIVGTGAVCLDDKRVALLRHSRGEEAAREYRRAKLDDRYDARCGTGCMHRMARLMRCELAEPYSDEPLRSYGLSLDMRELNRPRQKGIALRAFPRFWSQGYYRPNSPLQVNSRVRDWHDLLLQSEWNVRQSTSVVAVYNDIYRHLKTRGSVGV